MSIVPRSEIGDYEWFEEIERLDDKYLNKYEKGINLNKQYILDLWKEMEDSFIKDEWQNRVDR